VLPALAAALSSLLKSRASLQLENLALRHQIGVLQRSAKKRPKLTAADRVLWAWLCGVWSDWRSALVIVKPETVIAWHRKGFRLFWTWKVRRGQPIRGSSPGARVPWPRSAGGYSTFHFCSPADHPGCMVTSRRNPLVVTGLKLTMLYLSFSMPQGPVLSTGCHAFPFL
jgi:hypothetical protein